MVQDFARRFVGGSDRMAAAGSGSGLARPSLKGRLRISIGRLFPPDPGAIRLHDAACATLSGLATFAAALVAGFLVPLPAGTEVFGFAASVFAAVSVHDDTMRAQRIT